MRNTFLPKLSAIVLLLLFACPLSAQYDSNNMSVRWYGDSSTFVVVRDGKFGIVRGDKEIIPVKYEIENLMMAINWDGDCYYNDGSHFALGAEGKWGVMDNNGNTIVPFEYDYITMEREYETGKMLYAGVEKNGKCAIMGRDGKLLTGFEFSAFFGFYHNSGMLNSGNTLAVEKGGKILFYDPATKKLLAEAPKLEFTPEATIVTYRFKSGAITRTGKILLPIEYQYVRSATIIQYTEPDQPLAVYVNDSCGLWWPGKGFVIPCDYRSIQVDYSKGVPYAIVMQDDKYALFSGDGKPITDFIYDSFSLTPDEIYATKKIEQTFTLSPDGKAVLKKQE